MLDRYPGAEDDFSPVFRFASAISLINIWVVATIVIATNAIHIFIGFNGLGDDFVRRIRYYFVGRVIYSKYNARVLVGLLIEKGVLKCYMFNVVPN